MKVNVSLPEDLVERARNAAVALEGSGQTLSGLVRRGLERELALLEKAHGGPFRKRRRQLKRGRPVSTS